jgi:hypothetical protein
MVAGINERYIREHWEDWNGVGDPPPESESQHDNTGAEASVALGAAEYLVSRDRESAAPPETRPEVFLG